MQDGLEELQEYKKSLFLLEIKVKSLEQNQLENSNSRKNKSHLNRNFALSYSGQITSREHSCLSSMKMNTQTEGCTHNPLNTTQVLHAVTHFKATEKNLRKMSLS